MRHKGFIETDLKILQLLAEEKEFPQYSMDSRVGSSYRTIMRRLSELERSGLIRVDRREKSRKKGKERKIYALAFKGFVLHLASMVLEPISLVVFGSESKEETIRRISNDRRRYNNEALRLVDTLEFYGNKLDYTIFKEIRWLVSRFPARTESPILREILKSARFVESYFSNAKGLSNYLKHLSEEQKRLRKQKKVYKQNPLLQSFTLTEGFGEEGREIEINVYQEIKRKLELNKEELEKTLEIESEQWKWFYAESFFVKIAKYPLVGESSNKKLRKLAQQLIERKKNREIAILESVSKKFS